MERPWVYWLMLAVAQALISNQCDPKRGPPCASDPPTSGPAPRASPAPTHCAEDENDAWSPTAPWTPEPERPPRGLASPSVAPPIPARPARLRPRARRSSSRLELDQRALVDEAERVIDAHSRAGACAVKNSLRNLSTPRAARFLDRDALRNLGPLTAELDALCPFIDSIQLDRLIAQAGVPR